MVRGNSASGFVKTAFPLPDSASGHAGVFAAASDFLVPHPRTRAPYLPVPDETIRRFRRRVAEELPDLVWHPQ